MLHHQKVEDSAPVDVAGIDNRAPSQSPIAATYCSSSLPCICGEPATYSRRIEDQLDNIRDSMRNRNYLRLVHLVLQS